MKTNTDEKVAEIITRTHRMAKTLYNRVAESNKSGNAVNNEINSRI
jgi:hypothetical protein